MKEWNGCTFNGPMGFSPTSDGFNDETPNCQLNSNPGDKNEDIVASFSDSVNHS